MGLRVEDQKTIHFLKIPLNTPRLKYMPRTGPCCLGTPETENQYDQPGYPAFCFDFEHDASGKDSALKPIKAVKNQ